MFFASIEIKIFNKIFIFVVFAYIYLCFFVFASFVFVFIFSHLSYLFWNFQHQQWSIKYLRFNQWIFSQYRSIKKKWNNRFETKFEEKKKIMLRTCLKISIKIIFYQRKFTSNLMKIWRILFIKYFDFHVNICFLNQIFSLCYLFIQTRRFTIN